MYPQMKWCRYWIYMTVLQGRRKKRFVNVLSLVFKWENGTSPTPTNLNVNDSNLMQIPMKLQEQCKGNNQDGYSCRPSRMCKLQLAIIRHPRREHLRLQWPLLHTPRASTPMWRSRLLATRRALVSRPDAVREHPGQTDFLPRHIRVDARH